MLFTRMIVARGFLGGFLEALVARQRRLRSNRQRQLVQRLDLDQSFLDLRASQRRD